MSTEDRIDTHIAEFVDEATGKVRKKRVRVVSRWYDDIPRHHGDGEGWSGWVECSREEEILPEE